MPRLVLLTVIAAALTLPAAAPAADPVLIATVGPGETISLRTPAGDRAASLEPGSYEIRVSDESEEHNFHLMGPGVDEATEVGFVGSTTWRVTVKDGRYSYFCDPHFTSMRGSFTAGTPPATPPAPAATPIKLTATVGPGATISLKKGSAAVRKLARGSYSITVRDRSAAHNFHLTGPGVGRKTTIAFTGTVTWKVTVRKGTYRFVCDAHPTTMRGSFTVT